MSPLPAGLHACHAGMASPAVLARLERIGQGAITPQQGLTVLGASLANPTPNPVLAANPFSWPTFLQHLPGGSRNGVPAHFREFEAAMEMPQDMVDMGMPAAAQREGTSNQGTAGRKTVEDLVKLVSAAVRDVAGDIGLEEPLMSAGASKAMA